MSGTIAGGRKAARTNIERYGKDFYRFQGAKGGAVKGTQGGFASSVVGADGLTGRQRASIAGTKGGYTSRRGPAKVKKATRQEQDITQLVGNDITLPKGNSEGLEIKKNTIHDVIRIFKRR